MCKYKNVCLLQTRSRLHQRQRKTSLETEHHHFLCWYLKNNLQTETENAFKHDLALTGKEKDWENYYTSARDKQKHVSLHKNFICQG